MSPRPGWTVETFNERCPPGTRVQVLHANGVRIRTRTVGRAWALGDGTPVVQVKRAAHDIYRLDHVEPEEESP